MDRPMESVRIVRDFLAPNDALSSRIGQVYDPAIMAFRPQRFSLASSRSSLSWDSLEYKSESQKLSDFSYAGFAPSPSLYSTLLPSSPSLSSQRSSFITQQKLRSTKPPPPVFQRLPLEIYECILLQLRTFHESQSSASCQTCYLRDLCSLALTSRTWDRVVRARLYSHIYVVGNDSPVQAKKFKMKFGARLKLLRRTLRERRVLAQHVRQLKVPRIHQNDNQTSTETIDLIASVVMSCPNLEKVVGFYPIYGHSFDRLTYALSTRRKLKEHVWIIGPNSEITLRSQKQLPPGLMDITQKSGFLHYHQAWSTLTTLFLYSHSQGILERDIFIKVLNRLPSLQHLCISHFDVDDFDDMVLQALPPLRSLRLENLDGVTFWGLVDFARALPAQDICNLSLINIQITHLSTISNLLLNLRSLVRFTLVQKCSPEISPGELVFYPIIASEKLEYLHWDISLPGSANDDLAKSIRANGFPNLRTIKAPSDHDGQLQAVCRPKAQIELPSDKYSKGYIGDSAKDEEHLAHNLCNARKAAQQRIENARKTVQFRVEVEENGIVNQAIDLPGFVGTIGSKITYNLEPDIPGDDKSLIDFSDLTDGTKEIEVKDGCTGMWNASHHGGKRWWSHTERYRYRPFGLQKFF